MIHQRGAAVARFFVAAVLLASTLTPCARAAETQPEATPLPGAACAHFLNVRHREKADEFVVVMGATQTGVYDLHLRLFGTSTSYTVDANSISVATPAPFDDSPFRSAALVIAAPSVPIVGFTVLPSTGGIRCLLDASSLDPSGIEGVRGKHVDPAINSELDEESAEIAAATPLQPVLDAPPAFGCDKPWQNARTIDKVQPRYPAFAVAARESGTVQVRVRIDRLGNVAGTKIYASSGFPDLDAAAVDTVRRTTYAPEIASCIPVPSSYLYVIDYSF